MASEANYETLQKELNQIRSDVGELTRTLRELAASQGRAAYDNVRKTAHKAQEQVSESVDAVGREIGERPFTSVLGAFGIGLLIGVLFSRRS